MTIKKISHTELERYLVDLNNDRSIPGKLMDKFWEIKSVEGSRGMGIVNHPEQGWLIIASNGDILWKH